MAKEYSAVDICKFICAILVIIIHTKPFETIFWVDSGLGVITRFAVPFFFVASSIFLFMKIKDNPANANKIYKGYFFRLLLFYAIWYVVFNINYAAYGYRYDIYFYLKQFFFNTSGSPLWFLCALLWSSAIVFFLTKFISKIWVMAVSVLFLIVGYMFSTLNPVFNNMSWFNTINNSVISFIGTQNGFFFGLPYVALGAMAADWNLKKNNLLNVSGIVVSMLFLMLEALFAVKFIGATLTFLWLSALPLTYFTLQLSMTLDVPGSSNFFHFIRKSSTLIYVLHVIVMGVVANFIKELGLVKFDTYNLIYFFATAIIAVSLSFCIVKLSAKPKMKFLRYIM